MEKHLEFIQAIISRMSHNSFLIKGWAVALVSALFALAVKDANQAFITIAYFPTLIFWLLDGYYLYQERLFRRLYDHVRVQSKTDYTLSTKKFDKGLVDWFRCFFSVTIFTFYGVIIFTLWIVLVKFI